MSDRPSEGGITRRQFFSGMLGAGVVIAGSGVVLSGCSRKDAETELVDALVQSFPRATITFLDVDDSQIVPGSDFVNATAEDYFVQDHEYVLPLGSLIYQASDTTACVLTPGAQNNILISLALLDLPSGKLTPLLNKALDDDKHFSIYDARASESVVAWVECDMTEGNWILYAATLDGVDSVEQREGEGGTGTAAASDTGDGERSSTETDTSVGAGSDGGDNTGNNAADATESNAASTTENNAADATEKKAKDSNQLIGKRGKPLELDRGDTVYDPPTLCVHGNTVYWTVMPDPRGPASTEDSYLKAASVSPNTISNSRVVYTSHGRMITNPQANNGFITIVPRVDTVQVRYQLTALNAANDDVVAVSVLPTGLLVSDCVFIRDGFAFNIEGTYTFAGGLGNYGTYEQLNDSKVFFVYKIPALPAALVGDCLLIKSTMNIIGFDLARQQSFILDKPNDCADYGDLLAGSGLQKQLVVYTTIVDKNNVEYSSVRVRIYSRTEIDPGPEGDEVTEDEGQAEEATGNST